MILNLLMSHLPPAKEQNAIVAEIERHFSIVGGVEAEVDINLKRAESLRRLY